MESVDSLSAKSEELINMAIDMVALYSLDVVAAIVTLMVGFWIAGRVKKLLLRLPNTSEKIDPTVANFLASIARYLVIAVTVLAVLERFGVQTTSLVAMLGAAGLAVGLALQGTLSNIAAGAMLLIFRPFGVGQFIKVAGHSGTVRVITLFTTELDTSDNIRIIIPNASVWGSSIINMSYHDRRRLELVFGIGYDDDINHAMTVIKSIIGHDSRCHSDPEPFVAVTNLGDSSVDITVRIWCDSGDKFSLNSDLLKATKEAFDAEKINIPYPTTTVIKG